MSVFTCTRCGYVSGDESPPWHCPSCEPLEALGKLLEQVGAHVYLKLPHPDDPSRCVHSGSMGAPCGSCADRDDPIVRAQIEKLRAERAAKEGR